MSKILVLQSFTFSLLLSGLALGADVQPTKDTAEPSVFVPLPQEAFEDMRLPKFSANKIPSAVFVDRTTGEVFLSTWGFGVLKSGNAGKTFTRIDGGKISGAEAGPFQGNCVHISPEGRKIAIFNMWNKQGPSGFSIDGGKTWESFTNEGRDWDFGAMDWDSNTVFAARHEAESLHLSNDNGKTWLKLEKKRNDPWVTGLGVVDKNTLLVATLDSIERSEDGGKTWAKVSVFGAMGPALEFNGKLWWLSGDELHSIIVSTDAGKTWQARGEPTIAPVQFGPMFGKDENHIVLAGRTGFYETNDGCKTWNLVVPLREKDFNPVWRPHDKWLRSVAFDPVHDIFYFSSTFQPPNQIMKYDRTEKTK